MKRITRKLSLSFIACMSLFALHAQTDVTATYLKNADFETDPILALDGLQQPANNTVYEITGWTLDATSGGFKKLFTMPYDATATGAAITSPSNGSSVQTGNSFLLTIKTHWDADTNFLEQTVILPIGKYNLTWDSFVKQTLNGASSMCGVVIDGVAQYKPLASGVDAWSNNTLEFTLASEKSVTIRFGYKKTTNSDGANSPVLFVDNVKLAMSTADKTLLAAKIQEIKDVVVVGSPGETTINQIIASAQAVYDNVTATAAEIILTTDALDAAKLVYTDSSLTDLKIDGTTVVGFNPTTLSYNYATGFTVVKPVVTATVSGVLYGASATITAEITATTVTVTAGNGTQRVYTVNILVNFMTGWDANGDITKSPYDAGWRTTDPAVIWTTEPGSAATADKYQYRDAMKLAAGINRTLIHPKNHAIFSYPVMLEEGKLYAFSCSSAKMSGNATRPSTFALNDTEDGTGTVFGSDTNAALKWDLYTNHAFNFGVPATETYYVTWQTQESDGDRSLAWNFTIVELGDAIGVEFEPNNASPSDTQYVLIDGKVTKPAEPIREGYVFAGWYAEPALTTEWNFENTVSTSMTLYAKWDAAILVNFEPNNTLAVNTQYVPMNGKIIKPADPINEGFLFAGWYSEPALTTEWNFENTVSAPMTLYAKWDVSTSVSTTAAQQTINVIATEGGVRVIADKSVEVKVISILGQVVKTVNVNAGETVIALPAGFYFVNGIKTIVR